MCLFVCSSVCEQLYVKNTERIFGKILPQINLWTGKNLLIFLKARSAYVSESKKFLKDSSTLRKRAFFHNVAHMSEKKLIGDFTKIITQMYTWTRNSPLKFRSRLIRVRTPPDPYLFRLGMYSLGTLVHNAIRLSVRLALVVHCSPFQSVRVHLSYSSL